MEVLNTMDIDKIVGYLNSGGIVSLPTDTIYGFSCLATDDTAISRLCKMKNRDDGKQFILLVSKFLELSELIDFNDNVKSFINLHTPANLTMIVNKNKDVKLADIFELSTLAIRVPNNDFIQSVLDKVGYMVSTSCNVQGEPYINDYKEIMTTFPNIDAIVVADSNQASPSTIVDLTGDAIKIVRQGDYIIN